MRLIQLSDFHVTADPKFELKGICTRDTLERVLSLVESRHAGADYFILTGDLTHDEQFATYEFLRDRFADYAPKLHVIPGNHDDRQAMLQIFNDSVQSIAGRITFIEHTQPWKIMGLDSHMPGATAGKLGKEQLQWFDEQVELSARQNQFVIVFVHHPPITMNSPWLDRIGLEDAEQLLTIVKRHGNVRLISTGHVHQERTAVLSGTIVVTSPSTGVQFRPNTEQLEIDSAAPGLRVIDLEADGQVNTWIERLNG